MPKVDVATIRSNAPSGLSLPPLLAPFGEWLATQPHGSVGYFDTFAGEPMPEGLAHDPSHVAALRARLAIFLGLPDGSLLALWDYGAGEPAVVQLGSEGDLKTVAATFEDFLVALSRAETGVSDLDDSDASSGRDALATFLETKGVRVDRPRVRTPHLAPWFTSGGATAPELPVAGRAGAESTLTGDLETHIGKRITDAPVRAWLEALGVWPVTPFGPGENEVYVDDKERGFCLTVRRTDADPQTAHVSGCFFHREGDEGHRGFAHAMPLGITFGDDAAQLVARIGAPKFEHKNKKTGKLTGHRWQNDETNMVSASYKDDGRVLAHVYRGILR